MKIKYLIACFILLCGSTLNAQDNIDKDSIKLDCYKKSFIEEFTRWPTVNKIRIDNICDSKYDVEIRVDYCYDIWSTLYWRVYVIKSKNNKWYLDYYEKVRKDTSFYINKVQIKQGKGTLKIDSIYNELVSNNVFSIKNPFKLLDSMKVMRPGDASSQLYDITTKNHDQLRDFSFSNAKYFHDKFKDTPTFLYCYNIGNIFNDLHKYIKQVVMKNSTDYPIIIEK